MGNLHGLFYSVGAIAGITAAALAVLGYSTQEAEENGEVIGK